MASLDEVFALLSRERRRYVLYYLAERDEPVSVAELARQVAVWEADGATDEGDADFGEVTISLEHEHLPKIENAEFVEYDREGDRIRVTDTSREFGVVLSVAEAFDRGAGVTDIVDLGSLD